MNINFIPFMMKKSSRVSKDEVPYLIFEDEVLKKTIAQWMHLKPKEDINYRFGRLLKAAGIPENEVCILDQFNESQLVFHCWCQKNKTTANISLGFASAINPSQHFGIQYKNVQKQYFVSPDNNGQPQRIQIHDYTLANYHNGNFCHRKFSFDQISFAVTNENYLFSLNISRPDVTDVQDSWDQYFQLPDEKALKNYLFHLSFPINVTQVFHDIRSFFNQPIALYPEIELIVQKRNQKGIYELMEQLSFYFGEVEKFCVTQHGQTVKIVRGGFWSYATESLRIRHFENGKIQYSFLANDASDSLMKEIPFEQYQKMQQEIEKVRKLSIDFAKDIQ